MTWLSQTLIPVSAWVLVSGCQTEPPPAPMENRTAGTPVATDPSRNAASGEPASPAAEAAAAAKAHPCLVQDGRPVKAAAVRAVGTEPFWGARTHGRCVTYSTPEDQAGTRVWAKVASDSAGTLWKGTLRGKPFELSVRPMRDCSDGMSDTLYPLAARVLVDGEERRGCAQPIASGR